MKEFKIEGNKVEYKGKDFVWTQFMLENEFKPEPGVKKIQ